MSSKSKKGRKAQNTDMMSQPEDTNTNMGTNLERSGDANTETNMNDSRQTQSLPVNLNEKAKSPLRLQRVDEKNMLIGFNNRLAAIIEKNHQLEHANNALAKEVHKAEENLSLKTTRLEATFGKELDDSRKQLQDANKENAKLGLTEKQVRKELEELQKKLDKKERDSEDLKSKLSEAGDQVAKLANEVQQANSKNADLTADKKDLEEEKFRLTHDLYELRSKFEEECMAKVELQEQLKGKIEENNVKTLLFEQEIMQVKSSRAKEIQEVDGRLQKEYELKLQDALKELRADYEMEIEKNKEEQKNLYNVKEADLVSQINHLSASVSSKIQELEALQAKMDDAMQKVANLEGEKHGLNINIQELKKKIDQDKEKFNKEKKEKDDENNTLHKEKSELIADYLDLLETKTALDSELATYRILLEGEEERLKLSPEPMKMDVNENLVEK